MYVWVDGGCTLRYVSITSSGTFALAAHDDTVWSDDCSRWRERKGEKDWQLGYMGTYFPNRFNKAIVYRDWNSAGRRNICAKVHTCFRTAHLNFSWSSPRFLGLVALLPSRPSTDYELSENVEVRRRKACPLVQLKPNSRLCDNCNEYLNNCQVY